MERKLKMQNSLNKKERYSLLGIPLFYLFRIYEIMVSLS